MQLFSDAAARIIRGYRYLHIWNNILSIIIAIITATVKSQTAAGVPKENRPEGGVKDVGI
jgi:hypothetical protein